MKVSVPAGALITAPNCCSTTTVASRTAIAIDDRLDAHQPRAERAGLDQQRRRPVDPFLEQIRGAAGPGGRRRLRVVDRDTGPARRFRGERGVHGLEQTGGRNLTARGGCDQRAVGHHPVRDTAEAVGARDEALAQLAGNPGDRLLVRGAEADTFGRPTRNGHDHRRREAGASETPRGVHHEPLRARSSELPASRIKPRSKLEARSMKLDASSVMKTAYNQSAT